MPSYHGSQRTFGLLMIVLFVAGVSAGCGHFHHRRLARRERLAQQKIAEAEAAIRANTVEWSKASQSRDLEKAVSFYADDALQLAPHMPAIAGKENIRKGWQQMLAMPGPGLTFQTTGLEVARADDMAWEHGTYDFSTTDKKGKVTDEKGKYLAVWKKQADGAWKVVADMESPDQ
jgi:uncharacterized protein (TIGR02246 family)